MDYSSSFIKKLPAFFAALVIIIGSLAISRVIVYEYTNPKVFAIEIGMAITMALVLIFYPFAFWKKALKQPIAWGVGLFLLTLVITTLTSIDRITSWFGNIDRGTGTFFIGMLAIAAIALGSVLTKDMARKYLLVPITISASALVASLYAEQIGWKVLLTAAQGGFLGNNSLVGTYLLMALFITIYLWLSSKTVRSKWIYGILIAFLFINPIFVNFSFFNNIHQGLFGLIGVAKGATISTIIGLIVSAGVWMVTSQKRIRKIIGTCLLVVVVIVSTVGILQLVKPQSSLHAWFVKQETDVRFIYWHIGMEGFKARPVVGSGPETYGYTYQKYFNPIVMLESHSGEIWSNKPHNMFIQVLSETGMVGMIGYAALFIGLIYSLVQLYVIEGDRRLLISMSGLLAAYMFNNLILFDTVTSYLILFMIIAYCIASVPSQPEAWPEIIWQKILRYILAIGIVCITMIIVIPQIVKTNRAYKEFIIPLDQRAAYYEKVENTASYGSALFLAQRADFSYESVFFPNLSEILQQNKTNRIIAATDIQALIDAMQNSFKKYPVNEEGELSIGRLANIKMVILNAPDTVLLATMKNAAMEAITIGPTNPNGYLLLGQEYIYQQDYAQAYAEFEKARALEPAFIQPQLALINLAQLLHDQNRLAFYIMRAQQQSPDFNALVKIQKQ
jgi:O-antigen ligase